MNKPKTEKEIEAEVKKLKKILPTVRRFTVFGDDNHSAMDAEIRVLEDRLTLDDVQELEDDGDFTEHQSESAIYAVEWLNGESEDKTLSENWLPLVLKPEKKA